MSGKDAPMGPIIDEMLCFILNKFSYIDPRTLEMLCDQKYSDKEVETSKELLFGILNDPADPTKHKKRRSNKETDSKKVKNLGDIFALLQEKGTSTLPVFVAQDLSRLPPITFDHIDVTSLLRQMEDMKSQLDVLKDVMKYQCEISVDLKECDSNLLDRIIRLEEINGASKQSELHKVQEKTNKHGPNLESESEMPLSCTDCDPKSECRDEISVPNANKHDDKVPEYICSECDYKTYSKKDLEIHLSSHNVTHGCSECDHKCNSRDDLDKHMLTHKGENIKAYEKMKECQDNQCDSAQMFNCTQCAFKFYTKDNLDLHLTTHKVTIVCAECNLECNSRDDMETHKISHKADGSKVDTLMNKCEECTQVCDTEIELNTHMQIHRDEKAFTCHICGFKCLNSDAADSHMKTHMPIDTNERLYTCTKCVYESKVKDDMDKHMIQHTEDSRSVVNKPNQGRQNVNVWETLINDKVARQELIDSLLNTDGFSAPIKNGKPMTLKDLQKKHRPDTRGQRKSGIVGTAKGPSLAVMERRRQAMLFATRYRPEVDVATVKGDLEFNLRRLTGENHEVVVEKIPTRYESYASFKVTCVCKNTDVFENADLWPAGTLVKWWRKPRSDQNKNAVRNHQFTQGDHYGGY